MKKYVKSAGGVIYESKDLKIDQATGQLVKDEGTHLLVVIADKEADTIEDLCDAFVLVRDESKFPRCYPRDNHRYHDYLEYLKRDMKVQEKYGNQFGKDYAVRAAIWTERGLIYVAEMNEKGEWELI